MNREIKFRGIGRDSGEWIIGSLVQSNGETLIFPEDAPDSYDNYIVKPETVGQFTGLKDGKGTDIFEGDLIHNYQTRMKGDGKIAKGYPSQITLISEIVFVGGSYKWPRLIKPIPEHQDAYNRYNYRDWGLFHLTPHFKGSKRYNENTGKFDIEGDDQTVSYVTVIGNVFDNPELITQ